MSLTRHVELDSRHPIERVFDFSVDCRYFPKYVHKKGIIPGVVRVEMVSGEPLDVGSVRRVTMTDGSAMLEELTTCERPTRHAYKWASVPGAPFGWMVNAAAAELRFTPTASGGTHITWDYTFTATTPLLLPVTHLVLSMFEKWMEAGMAGLDDAIGT